MSSINIKDLETAQGINEDDFIILEQHNGTKKIKIRDLEDKISQKILKTLSNNLRSDFFNK